MPPVDTSLKSFTKQIKYAYMHIHLITHIKKLKEANKQKFLTEKLE